MTSVPPRLHLHIFFTPAQHESRFLRQADTARRRAGVDRVLLAARAGNGLAPVEVQGDGIEVHRLGSKTRVGPLGLGRRAALGLEWLAQLGPFAAQHCPELVHAHSLYGLLGAARVAKRLGIPLIYDAHELETERNGLNGARQWVERRLESRLIRACDEVLCVSDSIADWYQTTYKIRRPSVIRNIPDAIGQASKRDAPGLRASLGIDSGGLVFLYQGSLSQGRRVEQLLAAFDGVPAPRHLVFMGYGALEPMVRAAAARQPNIHFMPAVPPRELLGYTAEADVGICGVENVCLSYWYALPNKLFEYLQAGIPTLAPAYPEMKRVIDGFGCGWLVGESTADWHRAMMSIDQQAISVGKSRAREAGASFSWKIEEERLLGVYRRLLR